MQYIKYAIISLILSAAIIPILIIISKKLNDNINLENIFRGRIGRIGGIAIFVSSMVVALYILPIYNFKFNVWLYFTAGIIAFLVGFIDDIRPYTAKVKFLMQVICAGITVLFGIKFENINLLGVITIETGFLSVFISMFTIVLFMNAINLIDGMDGLSSGILFTANIFMGIFGFLTENSVMILASLIICGALLGFLIFNFPPAKIYLGDGGAYYLGFFFATIPMVSAQPGSLSCKPLIVVYVLLMLPIIDLIYVAVGRILARTPIFEADKTHLHHRLLRLGLSKKQIIILFMGFTAICGMMSILIFLTATIHSLLVLVSILLISGILYYTPGIIERKIEKSI